jgi:thioredoxin 1
MRLCDHFWCQVVLDISSKTCGPCRRIYPMVVQLSIEYPDVIFLKINGDRSIDTSRALMKKWGVGAVPTFRFFRNGELVHSQTGAKLDVLKTHLAHHYNKTIKTQQM